MFTEATWQELTRRELAFRELFAGEAMDHVPAWYFNGGLGQIRPEFLTAERDRDQWLDNQLRAVKANVEEALDSASLFYPIIEMFSLYGTHFMDVLFGGDVKWQEEQFWSEPVDYAVADIAAPDLDAMPLVREAVELAIWIKEKTTGRFLISMPDVGCPLNIAINIFGEGFLLELALNPESAKRALMIIGAATRRVHELLVEAVGQQTLRCHNAYYVYTPHDIAGLSICATQLVSPDHFAELVAEADDACLPSLYQGLLQHLCGHSTQHIAELARRPSVRGVQLNDAAANDFEAYYNGLREDQVVYVIPTEEMPLDKILSISDGQRLVILAKLDGPVPL